MKTSKLPLDELSINQIYNEEQATYEVPIYQRNYAWEKEEVNDLIQDVYDAFSANKPVYYIGTLVSFLKDDNVYEVIDGQQRLTTINLSLKALGITPRNKLTFRARKRSDITINKLPINIDLLKDYYERKKQLEKNFEQIDIQLKERGIINGYNFASEAVNEIVPIKNLTEFKQYFLNQVHIIHYKVPKDIDLNHYFEIMNSRGEQLEKHEIIKARFIEVLDDDVAKEKFNQVWEYCSEMNIYIQQKYKNPTLFGNHYTDFKLTDFDQLPAVDKILGKIKIAELLNEPIQDVNKVGKEKLDSFQPIIDFSNFLLVVLKVTRMHEDDFKPSEFVLDDKELLREFDKIHRFDKDFAKQFGYNLLKAKFLLDNYMVHHDNDVDKPGSNPWKLQFWYKDDKQEYVRNLDGESKAQNKLLQLLSMFEVTFTARQRKNYLFYCLQYLFDHDLSDIERYSLFVSDLAKKYFHDIYLIPENLNAINVPTPGSFDKMIVKQQTLDLTIQNHDNNFEAIYGNGEEISKGIPLFVFNYLDYIIWEKYLENLKGEQTKETSLQRIEFFKHLGCSDFGLDVFNNFYFSRTRRSLEHFYPSANAIGDETSLNQSQINCLGNYAMIGNDVNSSGSNWSPKTKLLHYLDSSGKIKLVSVASLKFMIMMQICKDNEFKNRPNGLEWNFEDIKEHQLKMLSLLIN
ncbi:DUF262 domain-containing protein [Empedobacter falsenii]|uniref:DUF262 domain-containing protein n=1 Tax=Empedobacter sp. UBA5637 TaxID=1946442 RepID=UPI0025BAB832|nr:DUF262 domain-containing protein [Empedobacter sp. UBA5637]